MRCREKFIISLKVLSIISLLLLAGCNSEGTMKEHYENGNIKIIAETLNGEPNGTFTEYYESGVIKNVTNFKNGVQHGESKWYDESGRIIEVQNVVEGKTTTCKTTLYYSNGKVKSVIPYLDEKIHGGFIKYYSNGNKKIEGSMRFDKPVGKVTSYDSLGHIINECFYDSLGVKQNCNIYSASN